MERRYYDVFISYSRKDYKDENKNIIPNNAVSKIKNALSNAGISYWFDEKDIDYGKDFIKEIVDMIDFSQIFIFLSTKNSNEKSRWTSKEIATADELGKLIIPVRIDNTKYNKRVAFRISDLHFIEYYNDPEKGITDLINVIKKHLQLFKKKNDKAKEKLEEKQRKQIRDDINKIESQILCIDKEILSEELKLIELRNNKRILEQNIEELKERIYILSHSHEMCTSKSDSHKKIGNDKYIDLGLPSGLKWATCNVGANKPEDYGNYYTWKEIKTKLYHAENNIFPYKKNEDSEYVSKHDAISVDWDGNCRIPNKTELIELEYNCKWVWTIQNGVTGYKVTGPNGNHIFLPSVGYYLGTSHEHAGNHGSYWSSTTDNSPSKRAYSLFFNDSSRLVGCCNLHGYGQCIRLVLEP